MTIPTAGNNRHQTDGGSSGDVTLSNLAWCQPLSCCVAAAGDPGGGGAVDELPAAETMEGNTNTSPNQVVCQLKTFFLH